MGSKATVAAWCGLDEFIVTAHEDGTLNLWDTVRCLAHSALALCSWNKGKELTPTFERAGGGSAVFRQGGAGSPGDHHRLADVSGRHLLHHLVQGQVGQGSCEVGVQFSRRAVALTPFLWFFQIWSVGPHKNAHGDEEYLTHIKTYAGEPPLNSAAIVPGKPYVRLAQVHRARHSVSAR